jgi:pyruvate/2-oxoglutarate dehydrogenase complex dihydrolipoamide dehydrogenase (E3) component
MTATVDVIVLGTGSAAQTVTYACRSAGWRQSLHIATHYGDISSWYSTIRVALPHSDYKVLVEEGTDRILGAHLFGYHAEEVINLFALAIRAGMMDGFLAHHSTRFSFSAASLLLARCASHGKTQV